MVKACEGCGNPFEPPPGSNRQTCSRPCAAKVSWRKNRDQRIASITAAQQARGADISELNRRRWARPGEREKLSERNRRAWADPETRAKLSAAIKAAQSTPEMRQRYSEIRRVLWQDPEYRRRCTAIIRARCSADQYREMFSELLHERWQDPVWRARWEEGTRRRWADPEERARFIEALRRGRERRLAAEFEARNAADAREIPSDLPPPAPYEPPRSATRRAEEEAIALFMAEKGITAVPAVGSAELLRISEEAPLVYDRETKKEARRPAAGKGA